MHHLPKLTVVALVALGAALLAPAAHAEEEFHSELSSTSLHGEQTTTNAFVTEAGTVKCTTVTFAGMASGTSVKETTDEFTFSGCKAFGQAASIIMNACFFVWNRPVKTGVGHWSFSTSFKCPVGKKIEVSVPSGNCSLSIGEQTPKSMVDAFNEGSGTSRSILITSGLKEISYTVIGSKGSICGEPGAHTNAEYTGSLLTKGYESTPKTGQRGIWVE